jgi:hypothetical protein
LLAAAVVVLIEVEAAVVVVIAHRLEHRVGVVLRKQSYL